MSGKKFPWQPAGYDHRLPATPAWRGAPERWSPAARADLHLVPSQL